MFPLFIIVGWHVVQNHRTQSQIQPRTNYSQFGILLETGPQSAAIESSIYGDQLRWMRFSRNDSNRTYGNILDRDRFYLHSSPEWISDHWFKWVENTSLTRAFIIGGITKCNQLWRRAYPVIDKWQFACICMQPNSPAQSPLGARVGTKRHAPPYYFAPAVCAENVIADIRTHYLPFAWDTITGRTAVQGVYIGFYVNYLLDDKWASICPRSSPQVVADEWIA